MKIIEAIRVTKKQYNCLKLNFLIALFSIFLKLYYLKEQGFNLTFAMSNFMNNRRIVIDFTSVLNLSTNEIQITCKIENMQTFNRHRQKFLLFTHCLSC